MKQSSKRMLFAILLLGLSGCTAQAGPPRYLVTVPTDTQLSCAELDKTRDQVAATGIDAYQKGNYDAAFDLGLRLKWLKGLYKRKGCEELMCLNVDRIIHQQTGYSAEEFIRLRLYEGSHLLTGTELATLYRFIKRCRELGAW